jgi:hypothetical protein
MSSKKSSKKQTAGSTAKTEKTEKRPAKRKVITTLAEYEAKGAATPAKETPGAATSGDHAKNVQPDGPGKMSGLDAAVLVLREAGTPMTTGAMVKTMLEKGYWSTGGKTPASTIYAAILRECSVKGDKSRFRKTDRGHFELTQAGKEA